MSFDHCGNYAVFKSETGDKTYALSLCGDCAGYPVTIPYCTALIIVDSDSSEINGCRIQFGKQDDNFDACSGTLTAVLGSDTCGPDDQITGTLSYQVINNTCCSDEYGYQCMKGTTDCATGHCQGGMP